MKSQPKLSATDIEDVAGLIGEGVHTGLRKFSDHPASTAAWCAIQNLPSEDWSRILTVVAAQVFRLLAQQRVICLTPADKRQLHAADGCGLK
jgi:hypothetical protein